MTIYSDSEIITNCHISVLEIDAYYPSILQYIRFYWCMFELSLCHNSTIGGNLRGPPLVWLMLQYVPNLLKLTKFYEYLQEKKERGKKEENKTVNWAPLKLAWFVSCEQRILYAGTAAWTYNLLYHKQETNQLSYLDWVYYIANKKNPFISRSRINNTDVLSSVDSKFYLKKIACWWYLE